jgi:hypothetical protein
MQNSSERVQLIAGAALVAAGFLILFGKLDHVATQFHPLGTILAEALWAMCTAILKISQVLLSHIADQQGCVHGCIQRLLSASSKPLLLIVLAIAGWQDSCAANVRRSSSK